MLNGNKWELMVTDEERMAKQWESGRVVRTPIRD